MSMTGANQEDGLKPHCFNWQRYIPSGRTLVILIPLLWLFVFFILPLFLVLKISVSEAALARPPYLPLFEWSDESIIKLSINFGNYGYLIEDSLYYKAYLESLTIAFVSTVCCLLIGYPMAYFIAKTQGSLRAILLLFIKAERDFKLDADLHGYH